MQGPNNPAVLQQNAGGLFYPLLGGQRFFHKILHFSSRIYYSGILLKGKISSYGCILFGLSFGQLGLKGTKEFFEIRSSLLIGFFDTEVYMKITWCKCFPLFHDYSFSSLLSHWKNDFVSFSKKGKKNLKNNLCPFTNYLVSLEP